MKIETAALVAMSVLATDALAESPAQPLHGLFCATEAHLDAALTRYQAGENMAVILAQLNKFEQVCTLADRISYIVTAPIALGRAGSSGPFKYRAILVAVQVGANLRPIEPPVAVFFFREMPIENAAMET